jgi:hypothetical protein
MNKKVLTAFEITTEHVEDLSEMVWIELAEKLRDPFDTSDSALQRFNLLADTFNNLNSLVYFLEVEPPEQENADTQELPIQ